MGTLVGLGFWHAYRTAPERPMLAGEAVPVAGRAISSHRRLLLSVPASVSAIRRGRATWSSLRS